MTIHTIRKGLDLPIEGAPRQEIDDGAKVARVAVLPADYPGMRPKMLVQVGDEVKRGQPLFEDRKTDGVVYTAPAAGKVAAINRGEFRVLLSLVIELSASEASGTPADDDFAPFASYKEGSDPASLSREDVVALLAESGQWAAFRQRPFGRVPSPKDEAPHSIFVTAADSNPLAADPAKVLEGREDDFAAGLKLLTTLSGGKVFVCKAAGAKIPTGDAKVTVEEFAGPHPSGTVGYHIHTLDPVDRNKRVWHLNYQDVVAFGRLFQTGRVDVERVVALSGPSVKAPRLVRTRLGAELAPITLGELNGDHNRVVSGSVIFGRRADSEVEGFLGRYHLQVSALVEGDKREFLGWLAPGFNFFSVSRAFASWLTPGKKFAFDTDANGSPRAMVPIGMYESVFPFDILPTFLLRAILMHDLGRAEELGVLELDEEDMALCTYVSPGKHDFGETLRANLDEIFKEG